MMRRVMTLFDEYQSRENGKHTLRAMKENARQGFWNGALPPIGYRIVEAENRGAKVKKTLAIDPMHADTVRMIHRLALSCVLHWNPAFGSQGDLKKRPAWTIRRSAMLDTPEGQLRRRQSR